MDTISSSVSTLKVPSLHHSTPRELYHFKTPHSSHHFTHHHLATKPNSISNRTTPPQTLSLKSLSSSPVFSTSLSQSSLDSSPNIHSNPASGYAAALLDIAQCNSSLETVYKDVRRFLKLLRHGQIQAVLVNPFMSDETKGKVVKEVAKKWKFNPLLVGLLKMLIEKNKLMMVTQVLMEFERIYDELSGTRVVLVSSMKKLKEEELFGIAHRVQKLSGAVKVKVKNLFDNKPPAFAV